MRKFRILLYISIFILFSTSCGNSGNVNGVETDSSRSKEYEGGSGSRSSATDLTLTAWRMADSIATGMTLEEKVGQCFMPSIISSRDTATIQRMMHFIHDLHVGGVVLLKGDMLSAGSLSELGRHHGLIMAIDAEWGLGMRLHDAPKFPTNRELPQGIDDQLLYDYGREIARECRRIGIGMVLGPVIDVADAASTYIGRRSFGENPQRVADLGVSYAEGLESGGVISVAKHFPGHGSPAGDSHEGLQVVNRSLQRLDSVDLYPFRRYIESGLTGIMVGHLSLPAIDPDGRPASFSKIVIEELLRGELGFRGLVLTDALNMKGSDGFTAADALSAGADIILSPADVEGEISGVIKGVMEGGIEEEEIAGKVRRILFFKYLFGREDEQVAIDGLREDVSSGARMMQELLR